MQDDRRMTFAGVSVLLFGLPVAATAGVNNVVASGSILESTTITECFTATCNNQRCGNPPRSISFSLNPGPASVTLDQPTCALNNSDQSLTATASAHSTGSVTESVSGGQHIITFHLTGHASAHSNFPSASSHGANALSQITSNGGVLFQITDHPETISIGTSVAGSGFRFGGVFTLSTPNGDFRFGHEGTNDIDLPDTLPRNSIQPPGSYRVAYSVQDGGFEDQASSISAPEGDFDVALTVTVGSPADEIHWIQPAGGDFNLAANWDPQRVPTFDATHHDTAVFDLTGNDSPIPILANNNAAARMVIRRMNVDLNAVSSAVRALGLAGAFSFEVDDGGTLVLDNGVQFLTTNAGIGTLAGSESSVFVSGAGTTWSSTQADQLLVGSGAPGKVVVDHDGLLDSETDINIGGSQAGTLRVESGAHVNAANCTLNKGSIQVRGRGSSADSLLRISSTLDIGGQNGSGNVVIEDGGGVTAQKVLVGDRAGAGGETLTISGGDGAGNPSSLSVSGPDAELHVAGNAQTQIEIKDGGDLSSSGLVRIGENLTTGRLLVHGRSGGANASWGHTGTVFVGGQVVPSQLVVKEGGHVLTTGQLVFGRTAGDLGGASVSGSDANLTCGVLAVGADGHGELAISDGAFVISTTDIRIGVSAQVVSVPLQPTPASGGTGNGSVTIDGGSDLHALGNGVVGFDEPGMVRLTGGAATLHVDGTLVNATHGVISGNGRLIARRMINNGFISPGLSPGVIAIEGDYEQAPDGVLRMEIAGLGDGEFDVLQVTGHATLAGTLEVHMLNGYLPRAGDSVGFVQVGGGVSGNFSQITFPELADGFDAELALASDGTLRLTARSDGMPGAGAILTPSAELSASVAAPAPIACGAGSCGVGVASIIPFALLGLRGVRGGRFSR